MAKLPFCRWEIFPICKITILQMGNISHLQNTLGRAVFTIWWGCNIFFQLRSTGIQWNPVESSWDPPRSSPWGGSGEDLGRISVIYYNIFVIYYYIFVVYHCIYIYIYNNLTMRIWPPQGAISSGTACSP